MGNSRNSAENLQNEMLRLKKLVKEFEQFPPQINALLKDAAHDPTARARLENFHQALNDGLSQNFQKLKDSAIKLVKAKNAYQNSFLDPNFTQALTTKLSAAVEAAQSNKMDPSNKPPQAPKKKSKSSRSFA